MINHILFAQPIFAPDQRRADRNINSIQSMGQYLKNQGADSLKLTVILGGWAKTDELWNQVADAAKTYINPNVQSIRFDRNYGKAVVINKLVKVAEQQAPGFQGILTCDSDILFPMETKHMFGRLVFSAGQMEAYKKKPFGMVSLNQTGEGCHWKQCYENFASYIMNTPSGQITEKLVWPTAPSGIAGGCVFVSKKMWDVIGGYRVMGVYSGDDAFLLVDCYQRGFSYQMFDSLAIVHPPENDQEYAQWKVKVCQRDSMTGPKQNIDAQIQESERFWSGR